MLTSRVQTDIFTRFGKGSSILGMRWVTIRVISGCTMCSLHMLRKNVANSFLVYRRVIAACSRTPCELTGSTRSYSSDEARIEDDSATAFMGMKAKKRRYYRNLQLRKNRLDPHLEKKAREGHLFVPLGNVQQEWRHYKELEHLHTIGVHNAIFRDLFYGDFRPKGSIQVTYGDTNVVHHGNLLTPEQASSAPEVQLPHKLRRQGRGRGRGKDKDYASLILTNPDGHLRDNTLEVLHWMVTNIQAPFDDISTGSLLVPYLQPLPLRGTGFHRFVFSLFTHHEPLEISEGEVGLVSAKEGGRGTWLDQRTFSTQTFLCRHPQLQPFTFAMFQSQWDASVQHTFSNVLGYPEPVYGLEKEMSPHHKKQMAVKRKRSNKYRIL